MSDNPVPQSVFETVVPPPWTASGSTGLWLCLPGCPGAR
jgi:hypothetical protein